MPNTELLDKACKLFSVRVEKEGMDPRTMILLTSFYLMKRWQITDSESDEEFYEALKEDVGPDVVELLETFLREGRKELGEGADGLVSFI